MLNSTLVCILKYTFIKNLSVIFFLRIFSKRNQDTRYDNIINTHLIDIEKKAYFYFFVRLFLVSGFVGCSILIGKKIEKKKQNYKM